MTAYQLLTTLLYAGLAIYAVLGTVRTPFKRMLGLVLLFSWAVSNLVFWALPIDWRPLIFPLLDVFFALTAAKVGLQTKSRVPIILIILSILAMLMNAAFSLAGKAELTQINLYEITLNVIFATQCLITGTWGLIDELGRVDNLPWRNDRRRVSAQPSLSAADDDTG